MSEAGGPEHAVSARDGTGVADAGVSSPHAAGETAAGQPHSNTALAPQPAVPTATSRPELGVTDPTTLTAATAAAASGAAATGPPVLPEQEPELPPHSPGQPDAGYDVRAGGGFYPTPAPAPVAYAVVPGSKLFIGGLSPETTERMLAEYFSQFGRLVDSVVMRDHGSGTPRSRGFGFVTFADPAAAQSVLNTRHRLDGRAIDPKRALPRGTAPPESSQSIRSKKVFVGGIANAVTEPVLREFFEQFGSVLEVVLPQDSRTHRSRGFAFVTFEAKATADDLCKRQYFDMAGKTVEVRHATSKSQASAAHGRSGMQGRHGMRAAPQELAATMYQHDYPGNHGLVYGVPMPGGGHYVLQPMPQLAYAMHPSALSLDQLSLGGPPQAQPHQQHQQHQMPRLHYQPLYPGQALPMPHQAPQLAPLAQAQAQAQAPVPGPAPLDGQAAQQPYMYSSPASPLPFPAVPAYDASLSMPFPYASHQLSSAALNPYQLPPAPPGPASELPPP